jgi:hypothetical protein
MVTAWPRAAGAAWPGASKKSPPFGGLLADYLPCPRTGGEDAGVLRTGLLIGGVDICGKPR